MTYKCPKCGAEAIDGSERPVVTLFDCGSELCHETGELVESHTCTERQLAQQRERAERAEAELEGMRQAMEVAGQEAQKIVDTVKARIEALVKALVKIFKLRVTWDDNRAIDVNIAYTPRQGAQYYNRDVHQIAGTALKKEASIRAALAKEGGEK